MEFFILILILSDRGRIAVESLFIGAVKNAKNGCRAFKMDCCVVNNKWETVYKSVGGPRVFNSPSGSRSHEVSLLSPGHPEVHCQQLFSRTYLSLFTLRSLSLYLLHTHTHTLTHTPSHTRTHTCTHTHTRTDRHLTNSVAVDVNGKSYWMKEIFFLSLSFQMDSSYNSSLANYKFWWEVKFGDKIIWRHDKAEYFYLFLP